jgi:chemotaxis-related protein WspD
VVRYHPRDLHPVPATLAPAAGAYTIGLLPWREHHVGCLNDELLFYTLNKSFS